MFKQLKAPINTSLAPAQELLKASLNSSYKLTVSSKPFLTFKIRRYRARISYSKIIPERVIPEKALPSRR